MKLPERIPKRLREMALFLSEFEDGEGAWPKEDALAVIESLRGTLVAVSAVALFDRVPWGHAPSELAASIDRLPSAPDADYAGRSRSGAAEFIRRCENVGDESLFALSFPVRKDAA